MAHAVEMDWLSEHPLTAAEPPLPGPVAQNYYPVSMRLLFLPHDIRHVFLLREDATQRSLDSEHREEIGRDLMDLNLLRLSRASEGPLIESHDRGHLFEDVIVLLPFEEIIWPHSSPAACLEILPPDHHQPLRLTVWERSQHHRVYYTENGAVRADSQSQAERRYGGKHRPVLQHPQAVTKVFPKCLHYAHPWLNRTVSRV